MDQNYRDMLFERSRMLADMLMRPRLIEEPSGEEWAAVERAITDGLEAGGLRYEAGGAQGVGEALAAAARAARQPQEER